MAEGEYKSKILNDMPEIKRLEGESIENFMARVRYAESTVYPIATPVPFKQRFVDLDNDGNGAATGTEVLGAFNDPAIHIIIDGELRAEFREAAADAKEGSVLSVETYQKRMQKEPNFLDENGDPVPKSELKELDKDNNGTITRGEVEHANLVQKLKALEEEKGNKPKEEASPEAEPKVNPLPKGAPPQRLRRGGVEGQILLA